MPADTPEERAANKAKIQAMEKGHPAKRGSGAAASKAAANVAKRGGSAKEQAKTAEKFAKQAGKGGKK